MIINSQQEANDREKEKPKILKAMKKQREFEKGKKFIQKDHKTWILEK